MLNLLAVQPGTVALVILLLMLLLALIIALSSIRIVRQTQALVIERLGRYYTTWNTGLHWLVPFIDRVSKTVVLKEIVNDYAPQPVITKDNVTMQIDTVVYLRPGAFAFGSFFIFSSAQ